MRANTVTYDSLRDDVLATIRQVFVLFCQER